MTGLAFAAFPAEQILHHGGFGNAYPDRLKALLAVAAIIVFTLLSLFLYLARLWARRALIVIQAVFIGLFLIFIVCQDWRFVAHDLTRIAIYIIVLVPQVFVLAVLFHPDVVRTFPPRQLIGVSDRLNHFAATDVLADMSAIGIRGPETILKRSLVFLGAAFLVLVLLGTVAIGIAAFKGSALDKESKAYVDIAVPAIVSSWRKEELLNRASPEFRQATNANDLEGFFQAFRSLGKLQEYRGSQGQSLTSRILGKGSTISADYVARAQFERGTAKIYVKLIKHGGVWQIWGFRIDPAYSRRQPGEAMRRGLSDYAFQIGNSCSSLTGKA